MKIKSYILFICLLAFTGNLKAQKLTFCESVDVSGKVSGASDVFTITKAGGYFQLLVNLNSQVSSRFVLFDVYWVNPALKKEVFENSIRVPVDPKWTWFKKEVTFYKAGDYSVYVYDDQDQLLSAGKVKIIVQ